MGESSSDKLHTAACWEVVRGLDSFSFNVCSDCLIYLCAEKEQQPDQGENCSPELKEKATGFNCTSCQLFQMVEDRYGQSSWH
jgi:hypothetical protein